MKHDTSTPDGRPEPPPAARPRGTFALPTAWGRDVEMSWFLADGDTPNVFIQPANHGAVSGSIELGPKARVVATLRALARDLEAAPAWTAHAAGHVAAEDVAA